MQACTINEEYLSMLLSILFIFSKSSHTSHINILLVAFGKYIFAVDLLNNRYIKCPKVRKNAPNHISGNDHYQ